MSTSEFRPYRRTDVLRVSVEAAEWRDVIVLEGELDLASAPSLARTLDVVLTNAEAIVFDLDRLSFIDASGLSVILACETECQQRGIGFAVTEGSPQVRRVFDITGVGERLSPVGRLLRSAPRRSECGSRGQPIEPRVREAAFRLRDARHGPAPRGL